MNPIIFEITRKSFELPVVVDPVDDSTGYILETTFLEKEGQIIGILAFEGSPVALTPKERTEAKVLLLAANQFEPERACGFPLSKREEDFAADCYFSRRACAV